MRPRFWRGSTGRALRGDHRAQVIACYLCFCESSHSSGLYRLAAATVAHEIGSPLEGASKGLRRLQELGFCRYDDGSESVFVINMAREQYGESLKPGDNRRKALIQHLREMNDSPLLADWLVMYGERFHVAIDVEFEAPSKPLRSPFEAPSKGIQHRDRDRDRDRERADAAHPGHRFRQARERARKSQDEVARAHLAVTPRQLSRWERGQIDLEPMVVEQLREILDRARPAESDAHPDHAAFITWFTDEWREFQGNPAGPTWSSRTGAQVRERLQALGLEELQRRARNMFERARVGQWPCKGRGDATWGTLYRCTDELVTGPSTPSGQYQMPTLEDYEREAARERQEDER